ncbi:MAG: DUF2812 domain-containing protein [Peptostreptococcaceae bacterium]
MKKNKLKKFNAFDIVDVELLEGYLRQMALEGWMISKISHTTLTFEKSECRNINFFVDVTTKGINGNNENNMDYINSYKEKNIDYICGDSKFQIFINNSGSEYIKTPKIKAKKVFSEYIALACGYMILILNIYNLTYKGENFIKLITSTEMMLFIALFTLIMIINISVLILKVKKYRAVVKNKELDIKNNFKKRYIFKKTLDYVLVLFTIVAFVTIKNDGINGTLVTKNEIPLALEDFNDSVIGMRQVYKLNSSSPFGRYYSYSDYAFIDSVKESYDEASESYYQEHYEDSKGYLSYSVVESEHSRVLDMALDSILLKYDDIGFKYKINEDEAKDWGAKLVYSVDGINEKVVVYNDKVLTFGIENKTIDNTCIKIVKEKLIN